MAGKIIVSTLQSDTDNSISFVANTGATIFSANISHGIAGSFIADGSITAAKIADGAIVATEIADGAVTTTKIATSSITGNLIATNAISQNNIVSVNASVATVGTLPSARLGSDVMVTGNMPTFSAYTSSNFAVTNDTNTKVPYNTEDWDTASCYNTTDYRFTPNVAGYYQVNAALFIAPPAGATSGYVFMLYKNGSDNRQLDRDQFEIYFNQLASGSAIVHMNGTSDYIEIFIYQNSGGSLTLGSASGVPNYFQATLVRRS